MNTNSTAPRTTDDSAASTKIALAPIFAAVFVGVFMLWGVGFAQSAMLHDAAHDGRHAVTFPCH